MAQKKVYEIEDDGYDAIARNALISVFGVEVANEILENPEDEELDEELQAFIEEAPALDEYVTQ